MIPLLFFINEWQVFPGGETVSPAVVEPLTQTSTAYYAAIGMGGQWADPHIAMTLFSVPSGVTCSRCVLRGYANPLPVVVASDYSLWCPQCGFVLTEDTNFMDKSRR